MKGLVDYHGFEVVHIIGTSVGPFKLFNIIVQFPEISESNFLKLFKKEFLDFSVSGISFISINFLSPKQEPSLICCSRYE